MKEKLIRGDKKKIMEITGFSRPTIMKVLNGEQVESDTFKKVTEAIKKIVSERNRIKSQISKL